MKKRIIPVVVAIILVAASFTAIVVVRNRIARSDESADASAGNTAAFRLETTDRLAGYPATGNHSDSSTVEVQFGEHGLVRKTYAVRDNSGGDAGFSEKTVRTVNDMEVMFMGNDGLVCLAVWNNNNFAYTIRIDADAGGISAEEMSEYVRITK